jgi:DNA polymerase (family 10)
MPETPPVRISNLQVADLLAGVAARMQILEENRFRIGAFENAAESIRNLGRDVNSYYAENNFEEIPSVGKGIAFSLRELYSTGRVEEFDALFAQVPQGVVEMLAIPELGPKKVKRLWQELGIASVEALQAAAQKGALRDVKGFGAKTEARILHNIELAQQRVDDGRMPIGTARPLALALVESLQSALPPGTIEKIDVAGSLRRWKETIGDVDVVCVSSDPAAVMAAFRTLPEVADVIGSGETKTMVTLHNGLDVDLRVVEPKHWGATLVYFTGNREHQIQLREVALKRGWSLNEYGATATGAGGAPEGEERFFTTEEELYAFLNLAYVPPEMRENRGELAAARAGTLPRLIAQDDIRGEFHSHTTWSDGVNSVLEMAQAAHAHGYRYWCVSDHSVGLGIVQGVDAERLRRQATEIVAANEWFAHQGTDFRVLQGSEVEILADGELGLPDEVLATLDVVVASIHSAQRQDRETITARCLKVIHNPHVDILGHPTSRIIGARPPTELDMEQILQACKQTGTVVEINANPARLDVNDVYARRAVEIGCKLVINCDAHRVDDLNLLEYGIHTAQRGWITAADVVNTLPLDEALACFKDGRKA